MRVVEPFELSAFLDGELSTARAAEVKSALDAEPALRAEFDELARLDAAWRSAATAALWAPTVQLPSAAAFRAPWRGTVAVLVVLLALRFLPKLTDVLALGFILHGLGLVIVLIWVTHIARAPRHAQTAAD